MKQLSLLVMVLSFQHGLTTAQQNDYLQWPEYTDSDLGLKYSEVRSQFRIWSPVAQEAHLLIYADGLYGHPEKIHKMKPDIQGTWLFTAEGNLEGKYYAFTVKINNRWSDTVPDPYCKAVGTNGKRAQVVNLAKTNPIGWEADALTHINVNNPAPVIYELHIRDASVHLSSGIIQKGKFLGLTEMGTKNKDGLSTGIDHIKSLGITHVHLLPCFDYSSVDETRLELPQYNWGYDPLNYNTPEGSYSTNPADGSVRIQEFKELVKTFHDNGLQVVMDVVYNHTMFTEHSNFNQLAPGYYYRQNTDGSFSNASGCNNETASERPMMRRFIIESLCHWVKEYHIDGFRFDLMGIHDIETMNLIAAALRKIHPGILLYGEGWTAGSSPLPDNERALKVNVNRMDGIAMFSDDIRNAIKGSVFEHHEPGFISGKQGLEDALRFGIVASCAHPQVKQRAYANSPQQIITYCECHDNHILWDKLGIAAPAASTEDRKRMQQLAFAIILTSQGIPFFTAGSEFLRSKQGVENSYKSPDHINAIDWDLKTQNLDVTDMVAYLIFLRKQHPAFRLTSTEAIARHLYFVENTPAQTVAYSLADVPGDSWKKIYVAFNGSSQRQSVALPEGDWHTAIANNGMTDINALIKDNVSLDRYGFIILYQ